MYISQVSGEHLQDHWSSGLIGCRVPIEGKFSTKFSKNFSSETVKGMKPVFGIHVPDISLNINCVFSSPV